MPLTLILALACRDKNPPDDSDGTIPEDSGTEDACPVLHVDADLAFTDVAFGPQTGDLTVTNLCVGEASLEFVGALSGSAFSADLSVPALAPGETTTVTVTFDPPDFDAHTGEITWSGTGGDATTTLSGNAVADADGDGFDSEEAGGDDCDDTDASTYPGADDSWYDGVDSDCAGNSDYDQDDDGYDDPAGGGEDCDDLDPSVHPGAEDIPYDGEDTNCDGLSDADGDGYDVDEDCDDTDASVSPGAEEIWYDGFDQDCDEASDYDQDGDGSDSEDWGGTDCDDTDAAVYYDSGETARDLADDDCDGLVDEDFIKFGDIIVTELMMDPLAAGDATGEWFEVYNTSGNDIDMVGWSVEGNDGDAFTIEDSLVVAAGDYAVLGCESDTAQNGDVTVDYEYDRDDFAFNNSSDTIFLYLDGTWLNRAKVDTTWVVPEGASLNLDADYHDSSYTNEFGYWCDSTDTFGDGDLGTPGDANIACTSNDYDGDGYSIDDGDCDDADADISPDGTEEWDGIDNDCDGSVDDLNVDDVDVGYLVGSYGSYLGYADSMAVGDWDGDGQTDIASGGLYSGSYYNGRVYLVDGAPYTGYAGNIYDNEYAQVDGGYNYNYIGSMDPNPSDIDGDGYDDLFMTGSDYYYDSYGNYSGALYYGGSLSGDIDPDDADVLFSGNLSQYSVQAHVSSDVDGDGQDDIVYSDYANYSSYIGYLYVFMGSSISSGNSYELGTDADTVWTGDSSSDYAGTALGGGDIDGDGYDDLLIGAYGADQGTTNSGSVYLVHGQASAWSSGVVDDEASVTFYGEGASSALGSTTRQQTGDYDDDGTLDVALTSLADESVYVFYGATSLSGKVRVDSADVIITGSDPSYFGLSMITADFDGDGADDLAIGAPDYTNPYYYSYADEPGSVYLFYGADMAAGTYAATDASVTLEGAGSADFFGLSMAAADMSGDGNDDLIISAPGYPARYGRVWFVDSP
ncbi:MAG: hypothetical protein GY884_31925 [Proteobacteria bacterium]|nr:hypothetical protein [Pseudomonadota bacterium]